MYRSRKTHASCQKLKVPDRPRVYRREQPALLPNRSLKREHPGLRLIVDHMGLATRGPEHKRVGERIKLITSFAKHKNLAVKLSAIPGFSSEVYPFRDMTAHLRLLIDAFGPQRCFWGTDLTHQRGKYHYRQYVTHFVEELEFLSDDDRRQIMGDAIVEFLGWK